MPLKFQVDHSPILELLFASDVPLRCLDRSVAKEKLNLFQFASTTMVKTRQVRMALSDEANPRFQESTAGFCRVPFGWSYSG
jgi:hypothetical protein